MSKHCCCPAERQIENLPRLVSPLPLDPAPLHPCPSLPPPSSQVLLRLQRPARRPRVPAHRAAGLGGARHARRRAQRPPQHVRAEIGGCLVAAQGKGGGGGLPGGAMGPTGPSCTSTQIESSVESLPACSSCQIPPRHQHHAGGRRRGAPAHRLCRQRLPGEGRAGWGAIGLLRLLVEAPPAAPQAEQLHAVQSHARDVQALHALPVMLCMPRPLGTST